MLLPLPRAANLLASRAACPPVGPGEQFKLPSDLREWVEGGALIAWIQLDVDRLNWDNPKLIDYLHQHPDYRPRMMLSLLSFACLAHVLSSREIVKACHTDPIFRSLCQGEPPFAEELTHFRRKNRDLIAAIVLRAFVRALSARLDRDARRVPPELQRELRDRAVARLDVARHLDSAQA
jgi:hypothetical protein